MLDLCTGSGVLAIAAALSGAAEVTAVDVSRRAVAAVRLNARLNGVRVEALRGDLFTPVAGRRFDLIVSNPPYLPGDVTALPRQGLARATEGGRSGRAFIDRIAAGAAAHLSERGKVVLVYSTVCGEPETLELAAPWRPLPRVVFRHRGPLGPQLSARADWLRAQRRPARRRQEEILVVSASRSPVEVPSGEAALQPTR